MYSPSIVDGHIIVFDLPKYFAEEDMTEQDIIKHVEDLTNVLIMAGIEPVGVGLIGRVLHLTFLSFRQAQEVLVVLQFGREEVLSRMKEKVARMDKD
jgi:hypothetical protein